jgi:hypothetical protein
MAKLDKLSAESWNEIFEKFYNEIHKEVMTNLDEIRKDDSLQSTINPIISQKNSKQYIDKLKTLSQTSSTNSSSNIFPELAPYYANVCDNISIMNMENLSSSNISIIQHQIKKENSCKCLVTNEKSCTRKQLTSVVVVDVVEFIVEDEVTLNYFLDTNNILWKFAIIA